ncbi:MAG: hypothetical protein FWD11_05900, partial [Micrococcales bacterium]|nr:hypothetical protein [Micrococcales bacterium]
MARQQVKHWVAAARPATLGRSLRLVRLTLRGWALAAGATVFAVAGIAIGSPDLVRIAVLLGVVLAVGVVSLLPGGTDVQVRRVITTEPMHVGDTARVQVTVCRARTAAVHEQLSPALARQGSLQVWRSPHMSHDYRPEDPGHDCTVLEYAVQGMARGRWTTGPLTVTRSDV